MRGAERSDAAGGRSDNDDKSRAARRDDERAADRRAGSSDAGVIGGRDAAKIRTDSFLSRCSRTPLHFEGGDGPRPQREQRAPS
jgi:hypothetical protein